MSNLGFETDDPGLPGSPDAWTLTGTWTPTSSLFALGIGLSLTEEYEEWAAYQFALPVSAAVFDEDFESWLFPGFLGQFPTVITLFEETFESWVDGQFVLPGGGVSFDEDFESWATFKGAFPGTVVASFTENFESVALPLQVIADPVTNVLTTSAPHGLLVNARVQFSSTRDLPAPIAEGFLYSVAAVPGPTQLSISATQGGPVLDITSAGLGVHQMEYDPGAYWTSVNDSF